MKEGIWGIGGTAPSTSNFGSRRWVLGYMTQPRYHLCPFGNRLGAPHSRSGRFVERSNLSGELIQAPRSLSPQSSLHIGWPIPKAPPLLTCRLRKIYRGENGKLRFQDNSGCSSQFFFLVYLTTLADVVIVVEFYDNELEMASTTCSEHNIQDSQQVSIRDVRTVCASSLITSTQIKSVYRDDS